MRSVGGIVITAAVHTECAVLHAAERKGRIRLEGCALGDVRGGDSEHVRLTAQEAAEAGKAPESGSAVEGELPPRPD